MKKSFTIATVLLLILFSVDLKAQDEFNKRVLFHFVWVIN